MPSRLTSYDFETIIRFAKSNQIGYGIYGLVLFPIILLFLSTKKYLIGIYLSTFLLVTQLDLIDHLIDFLTADDESLFGIGATSILYPFLFLVFLFFWLVYKSIKSKKWTWYISFIVLVILTYLFLNDRNCTIEFVADMGIQKYDIGLWFSNCGTYYAWWISAILINIGLFIEIKRERKVANKT